MVIEFGFNSNCLIESDHIKISYEVKIIQDKLKVTQKTQNFTVKFALLIYVEPIFF